MRNLKSRVKALERAWSESQARSGVLQAGKTRCKLLSMFPDTGPHRRELYPCHVAFLEAGCAFRERLFMAANRIGKSLTGSFEMACHLTGLYPGWWPGKRFSGPVHAWACGTTGQTTRDIVQVSLLGPEGTRGSGMLPLGNIVNVTYKPGVPHAVDTVLVRHVSGGLSQLCFKTYESGRKAFEGTAQEVIWLDEESPNDIYIECLYRTATTGGIVYTTFTPVQGRTEVVKSFLEPESEEATRVKHVTYCDWSQVPHLDDEAKRQILASTPAYMRDARTKGIPQLGAGAIYWTPESEIIVPPVTIPKHWRRCYGLDVGWKNTAALWGAIDPATGVCYLYHEYYRSEAEAEIHAAAVRAVGDWIPGVVDPASLGSSAIDGRTLMGVYGKLGLDLQPAVNAVDTGIEEVRMALAEGRLKVFETLPRWRNEYRNYHRDEQGRIVKKDDHLMDATRYLWMSGRDRACTKPEPSLPEEFNFRPGSPGGWMR